MMNKAGYSLFINFCWSQSLFSGIIQKPIEKSYKNKFFLNFCNPEIKLIENKIVWSLNIVTYDGGLCS